MSSKVLDRDLKAISDDCRPGASNQRMVVYPRIWRTCQVLTRYLLDAAVWSQPGAVRVRMVIIHALMRVNVFWHAALDEQSERNLPRVLREVLTACLRDDDRIVRVEALRAVTVALRNIGILMERATGEHRERLRQSFFPLGLPALQWLVSTILENFSRYRRRTEPVLLSTPWSYITALASVIRLFPGDALGVCEQIARWGLGDSLELVVERLRGRRVETIRSRIRELWVVPALHHQTQMRDQFIKAFGECDIARRLASYGLTPRDADHDRASGLLQVYRRLALLWSVNHEADLSVGVPIRCRQSGDLQGLTGSLVALRDVLDELVEIARAKPGERVAQLHRLRAQLKGVLCDGQKPPDPVRFVLDRVIEHWQAVLEPATPTAGSRVGSHVLGGIVMERRNGAMHTIENPSHVIKVLRRSQDPEARSEFYRDARLSRELAERYDRSFVKVHEIDPTAGYAVMDHCKVAYDYAPFNGVYPPAERVRLARIAAVQLARALRCLHAETLAHGDLRAKNIFVSNPGDAPAFLLGDLHARESTSSRSTAELLLPSALRVAVPEGMRSEHWTDLVCLSLFLHWVRTGITLGPDTSAEELTQLAGHLARSAEAGADVVAGAISRMLGREPYRSAEEFEDAVVAGQPDLALPVFTRLPLVGRVRARYDVFISYGADDLGLARELYDQLVERGLVGYLDDRDATPDHWSPRIAHALDESRSFAVLVGEPYRENRYQAREVHVAREDATRHGLPLNVFLLGDSCPAAFHRDAVIRLGRDPRLIADRVIRSFEHPIDVQSPARDASG